jgi:two-component system probable response regulator PhcQ
MTRILLVDDVPQVLKALERELMQQFRSDPPRIEAYTNPFDALNRICACDFDLVICDFMMPEMSGGELLKALKDVAPDTVRIMLSASAEYNTVLSAINDAQAFRFVSKPWEPAELAQNVRLALELRASLLAARARPAAAEPALTPQEIEAQRLEAEEPGLLQVRRAADGSVIL